jgi:parallel beta-helix repeat protein
LDAVTLLLVIITPSFFRSEPCRREVYRFLERERELGRQDLVLPVYYVSTPELDDPSRREADELARVLAARQYADWRELRFEPFTSPVVRRTLAQLASRMADTFWHQPAAQPPHPGWSQQPESEAPPVDATATEPVDTVGPAAKTDPPTHVVDAFPQRGDFTTIGAAIEAARPGDRIVVRPGLYQEGLVVDKPLEILGDGPVHDIEIQARGRKVLEFKTTMGRIANVTLRQAGGTRGKWYGVDITQGRLELEGCDISSQSLACVVIRNGADPRLRRNRIHNSKRGSGVYVFASGLGTLEDNDITANSNNGLAIATGGNPTLRRNQIHDNKEAGVIVYANGLGTLEDNEIFANGNAVEIKTGGNPTLRHNQIHDNKEAGIVVHENGQGTLEDNNITANFLSGVEIKGGGNPTVRRNRINRNRLWAIQVHEDGRGLIKNNDLTDNKGGPLSIAKGSEPNGLLSDNRIRKLTQ